MVGLIYAANGIAAMRKRAQVHLRDVATTAAEQESAHRHVQSQSFFHNKTWSVLETMSAWIFMNPLGQQRIALDIVLKENTAGGKACKVRKIMFAASCAPGVNFPFQREPLALKIA